MNSGNVLLVALATSLALGSFSCSNGQVQSRGQNEQDGKVTFPTQDAEKLEMKAQFHERQR